MRQDLRSMVQRVLDKRRVVKRGPAVVRAEAVNKKTAAAAAAAASQKQSKKDVVVSRHRHNSDLRYSFTIYRHRVLIYSRSCTFLRMSSFEVLSPKSYNDFVAPGGRFP